MDLLLFGGKSPLNCFSEIKIRLDVTDARSVTKENNLTLLIGKDFLLECSKLETRKS